MDVLPYGGLMTKPLEDEKEREEKLKQQQVEVDVNGRTEVLRPEALAVRGVDNLSTDDITGFVDLYLNYKTLDGTYEAIEPQVEFRVQWINDTSVVLVFQTHEAAIDALTKLTEEPIEVSADLDNEKVVETLTHERVAKSYNPVLAFRKHQSLTSRLGLPQEEKQDQMEEDDTNIILYIRQAFQSDRKVKNAAQYSRYYLMHGEPERIRIEKKVTKERAPRRRRRRENRDDEEDLFADRLSRRDEEDLFAHKMRDRSRSPGR